jgi:hypothetical protein
MPAYSVVRFSATLQLSTPLSQHLETNNLIYKHQYGFSRNKSTEHALIYILNSISIALNDNKYCIGIFLDLKKAFDTVPHNILLLKLEKMGITGTELLWFSNYLSNRTQRVEVNGTLSESAALDMSVFQGTILIYIYLLKARGPSRFFMVFLSFYNTTKKIST